MSQVRHHQLLLARERALLEDLQLEVSHQLADAQRDVDWYYATSQTHFNRLVASEKEVRAVDAAYEANAVTLDLLLDAQRRRADAETAFYRSLVDYNRAIATLHRRKGSLLEYNNVFLAEGPWPAKAYFDALREARKRDASIYLNYGFTRPKVVSRGPYVQHDDASGALIEQPMPTLAVPGQVEEVETPDDGEASERKPAGSQRPAESPGAGAAPERGSGSDGRRRRDTADRRNGPARPAPLGGPRRSASTPRGSTTLSQLVAERLRTAQVRRPTSVRPAAKARQTARPHGPYLGGGVRR